MTNCFTENVLSIADLKLRPKAAVLLWDEVDNHKTEFLVQLRFPILKLKKDRKLYLGKSNHEFGRTQGNKLKNQGRPIQSRPIF